MRDAIACRTTAASGAKFVSSARHIFNNSSGRLSSGKEVHAECAMGQSRPSKTSNQMVPLTFTLGLAQILHGHGGCWQYLFASSSLKAGGFLLTKGTTSSAGKKKHAGTATPISPTTLGLCQRKEFSMQKGLPGHTFLAVHIMDLARVMCHMLGRTLLVDCCVRELEVLWSHGTTSIGSGSFK